MITLTTSGDSVVFVFDNNDHYLQQGTIEVPMNSLSLLIDSSDMVTFKKAASNDVFVSATLSELGMTKEQLITFYKENMVSEGGVPEEEIQAMIASATSGYADSVTFNSDNNYIEFYHDDTKVYELDASDFVIDGMIDDVRIETIGGVSYLVIDFNTASGKQDIQIPLTDIFDPSNYYTKTDIDTKLGSGFTSSSVTEVIESNERVVANAINSLNAEISGKVDTDTYTAYTAATDAALSGKQDTLSAGTNITIADNVISADIDVKGIEGGRGITVTTGETADTVSFNIPIYQGKGDYSLSLTQASGTSTNSYNNVVSGYSTVAIGAGLTVTNKYEAGLGVYNVNRPQSQGSPFGSSGCTLLTVGNGGGNAANQKHNALEVRQNGDIYYANTNDTAHTDFYTKPMVKLQDAIDGKLDASAITSSITSASTDSQVPTAKAVYDALESGGGVNVVQTTGTSTADVMSQDAVTTALNNKANEASAVGGYQFGTINDKVDFLQYTSVSYSNIGKSIYYPKINGKGILTTNLTWAKNNLNFSLVETSAITSSITSASTDTQVPSAKAVYDAIPTGSSITVSSAITSGDTNPVQGGVLYDKFDEVETVTAAALNTLNDNFDGLKLKKVSQAQYDALVSGGTVDNSTLYVITNS